MHARIPKAVAPMLLGLLTAVAVITCFARNPGDALATFFTGTFGSAYYVGLFLNTMALLLTAGTGATLSLTGGAMNLGGEGQIYLGGFVACLVLNALRGPAPIVLSVALVASCAAGAALALVSALLKELKGASVLLTSFLASAAVIPLVDSAIAGTKQDAAQNLLALPYIPDAYRLPQLLPPSPLTVSFFAALLVSLAAWLFMQRTNAGKLLVIWGTAPRFAEYCGFSRAAATVPSLAVSGALHALTGFFAVCGTYYTCHQGFYSGMGWNALTAALIARSDPLALVPAAAALSWLYTSAGTVSLTQGFTFDISGIVQGVLLFAIALSVTKKEAR